MIEVPFEKNAAKQLAARLQGKLPVVYGAEVLTEAAHRWKTQLNENSKVWAFYEELSELNHNAIEGYGLPSEIAARAHVVFLYHPKLNPRIILRYNGTHDALAASGVSDEQVTARGESELARVLTASLLRRLRELLSGDAERGEAVAGDGDPASEGVVGGEVGVP